MPLHPRLPLNRRRWERDVLAVTSCMTYVITLAGSLEGKEQTEMSLLEDTKNKR